MRPRALIAALALLFFVSGCDRDNKVLLVSAAASLAEVMQEVEAGFEASYPGWDVRLNLAGSGALARQIAAGASVDVFVSAALGPVEELRSLRLIDGAPRVFAKNALVLVSRKVGAAPSPPPYDLHKLSLGRLAVGDPQIVPAGRYARDALVAAGVWASLEAGGRLVLTRDVRHALALASRGEVEAAAVYATDVQHSSVTVVHRFDGPHAPQVRYAAAVTAASSHKKAARDFVAYLVGPQGQAILTSAGFDRDDGGL